MMFYFKEMQMISYLDILTTEDGSMLNKSKIYRTVTFRHVWAWWRHQMETFSALLAICAGNSPVPGEFPTQRPVTRSFDVFFDLRLNKWFSKQSWGWWFETLSCPLWRHCNGAVRHSKLWKCRRDLVRSDTWLRPYTQLIHLDTIYISTPPKSMTGVFLFNRYCTKKCRGVDRYLQKILQW